VEGSSRLALAAVRERLEALTTGAEASERLADDLVAVAGLLVGQGALRRALAEPSLPGGQRAALAARVLQGRVGEDSLSLVSAVVRERWSSAADLVDAVGELAAEATLARADAEGQLDQVEDDLFRFARTLDRTPELALALSDTALPMERKRAVLERLLGDRLGGSGMSLVLQALTVTQGRALDRRLDALTRLAAARRQRLVAVVRVARPMDAEQQERLRAALSRAYGRDVQLQVDLDPGILGGVQVVVGDELLDGTVARRLGEVRRRVRGR